MLETIIGTFVALVLFAVLFAAGFFGARYIDEKRETMKLIRKWLRGQMEEEK